MLRDVADQAPLTDGGGGGGGNGAAAAAADGGGGGGGGYRRVPVLSGVIHDLNSLLPNRQYETRLAVARSARLAPTISARSRGLRRMIRPLPSWRVW